jgi:Ser-tRNA(Ala) deacylase AlaX
MPVTMPFIVTISISRHARPSSQRIHEDGGIEFDQTCFYATSGGQPGDTGFLERADGSKIVLGQTRHGETRISSFTYHSPIRPVRCRRKAGVACRLGAPLQADADAHRLPPAVRRLPYPITGAAVGEDESRVDFDMTDTIDKDEVTAKLMALVDAEPSDLPAMDHRRGTGCQSRYRQIEERAPADRARARQPCLHRRECGD